MTAEPDALRLVLDDFSPIEGAPRDGTIFLGCNLDHPSWGVWPMCRRVNHTFNDQGEVLTTDLGAWLIFGDIEPDYHEGHDTGRAPSYSVAADDLNASVRYGWTPLRAAAPAVQPAAGRELHDELARLAQHVPNTDTGTRFTNQFPAETKFEAYGYAALLMHAMWSKRDAILAALAHPPGVAVRSLSFPGDATYQISETVTVTATGDETYAELQTAVAACLPARFAPTGGLERIRKGDPIPTRKGDVYDFDRQAHVAFVAHNPRAALSQPGPASEGDGE